MKVSQRCVEALTIIKANQGISAGDFAKKFWPDNTMHTKVKNTGNGACAGKAGWLCGGSYVGKLIQKGLARQISYDHHGNRIFHSSYKLTTLGTDTLNDNL